MRKLVIIPTYNEKENISAMIDKVFSLPEPFEMLVIDDGSPDGTAAIVKERRKEFPERLHLMERAGKLGLGTAYLAGFRWGLENGFDYICEMDCDFSHNPDDLIRLSAAAAEGADLVIGSVLIPGAKAPKLVTRDMLKEMDPGTVMVDVAIDQGGCFETSRPTTHEDPVYYVDGMLHYCVANIPGAVPRTSTLALTNATLPYTIQLADKGWRRAAQENPELALGLNIIGGRVVCKPVADAWGLPYEPLAL